MPPLREPVRQMREVIALAPGKPAWPAGLRAAIATVAPLVAGSLLGSTGGTWMSLAGFTGALADRGGPYRSRAAATGVLTLAGSVAVAIGTLSAGSLWVTVPVTFLFALGCSLARVWGISGATVGSSVLNIYVIALAYPAPSPREALTRAGYVVVGGLWAMFVSLILWPLRPFRPIRLAVAEGYRRLALYADGLALNAEGNRAHSGEIPVAGAQVREALEQARGALTRARRGVPGESGRGEKLLVLEEMADRLFGYLVGLSDMAATVADEQRDAAAQHALAHVFTALAATVRGVATQIEAEGNQVLVQVEWNGHALRALLDHAAAEIPDSAAGQYQQAALLIDRLSQYAGAAAATAATLNDGTSAPTTDIPFQPEPPRTLLTILGPVRAVLAPDSVVLRYALRMAIVVTVAVLLTGAIGLKRGYWVTITIVIILQPYTGATTIKALQRVAGTVLGGLLTAGLGVWFHDPRAIMPLAFLFACLSVAFLPINYAAFSVFLTPTFVLLAEASVGDWHLAGVRIVNTLLGGGLALLGARLLWPSPESDRLPTYLAGALRANRDYLRAGVELFGDRSESASRVLRAARREVGLAAANAEASFQRLLAEKSPGDVEMAPVMTFLVYSRRLTASIAALAITRHTIETKAVTLEEFLRIVDPVMNDLVETVAERRPPAPFPHLEHTESAIAALPPAVRARLTRLLRQLETLHDALRRWAVAEQLPARAPATAGQTEPV